MRRTWPPLAIGGHLRSMFLRVTGPDHIYVMPRPFLGLDAVSIFLVGGPMRQTGRQAKIIDPYCPTFLRGPPRSGARGPRTHYRTIHENGGHVRASEALSHAPQGTYGSVAAALSSSRSSLATSPHPATDFPAACRPPTGRQTVPVWSVGQGATSQAPCCGFPADSAATSRQARVLSPALPPLQAS